MTNNIQQLNNQFAIADQIVFIEGKGGLPCIKVNTKKASALISIYAGQVLSYKPVNEPEDLMFISENAYFQKGKAIKGGIPICWPWFGTDAENPDNPSHGFVRNNFWTVIAVDIMQSGDVRIKLEIVDSVATRKIWPYSFYLSLEIVIGNELNLELYTLNKGNQEFSITEALHTYFNIGNTTQVKLFGLENTEYIDKSADFVKACQLGAISINEETDHIHLNVDHDLIIEDSGFNRKIKITSSGNKNVVVWNPWALKSAEICDLKKNDYLHFLCVEIANVATNMIKILPGDDYTLVTKYSVIRD